jgi:1-acyl-sn-glycerol-3-phosphate acyltransferase
LYRVIRAVCIVVVRVLFDVQIIGREHVPLAGSIVAGIPHRNWLEPVLLFALLPARPRQVAIADGPTVSGSVLRRLIISGGGGVIKVQPRSGPSGFQQIARATRDVVDRGGVVTIFPEVGQPSRPPELRRLSAGVAHLAARSRAPVGLVVFGGTHELYLRRRIVMRLLSPMAPPVDSSRQAMAAFMADLEGRARASALVMHAAAESGSPRWKVGRWLTGRYPQA